MKETDLRTKGKKALWYISATPEERDEVAIIDDRIAKLNERRRELTQRRCTITNRCTVRTRDRRESVNGKG
jgi:hypothetical protein